MKAISLFSGIGGFELGFERAGIETILQAEIDPWCQRILRRHWPDTPRVSDVSEVGADLLERLGYPGGSQPHAGSIGRPGGVQPVQAVAGEGRGLRGGVQGGSDPRRADSEPAAEGAASDLIVYGGFPCQPFSVAGQRASDGDARNGWPEFKRILSELRPRWAIAENVPGLLSLPYVYTILSDLDELWPGSWGWAILDAQFFGVPQRRRRVFFVAGPSARSVASVLSVCEGCEGHSETSRTEGEGVASTITGRSLEANGATAGKNGKPVNAIVARTGISRGNQDALNGHMIVEDEYVPDTAYSIAAREGSIGLREYQTNLVTSTIDASDGTKWGGDQWVRQNKAILEGGVRRLTPLECERLQGFPEDWTRYDDKDAELADRHRYHMLGNAVAVPVIEWLARRINAV